MTDVNAEALKTKLHNAINNYMSLKRQGKTEAVSAIAGSVDVQPRQIYKWLNAESLPHNAENVMLALDTMMDDMKKFKTDIRAPLGTQAVMRLPFRVMIPRESLKVSQDDHGNVIVHGSLSVDLI